MTTKGTILALDFDQPELSHPNLAAGSGTLDQSGTREGSCGLLLLVPEYEQVGHWEATLDVGSLPIVNDVSDLGMLTVAISMMVSLAAPVRITVTAFDSDLHPKGSLQKILLPAAANYYQRFSMELDSMTAVPGEPFDPVAPLVAFSFEIGDRLGWPSSLTHRLQIDNLHYARPALFVSPDGDDANDGRSDAHPLRSPHRAIELAVPGDIVLLHDGIYTGTASSRAVMSPRRSGEPHRWITVKNFPAARPRISTAGQAGLRIHADASTGSLAYLEFRGLDFVGNAIEAPFEHKGLLGTDDPLVDSPGISLIGDGYDGAGVHHVRIAGCAVRDCTSDGVFVDYADWIAIEDCDIVDNCRTTVGFAPSGISVMHHANFDGAVDVPKFLIATNRVHGNRLTVFNHPHDEPTKHGYYNGNGILLDANATDETESYMGRTLVQNNLVYGNGGGGIQCWGSHRLDIVNNTVALNGQTPELKWGQLGLEFIRGSSIVNNLVVSQVDVPLDTWFSERPNFGTADLHRVGNVYVGGSRKPALGSGDVHSPAIPAADFIADPATDYSVLAEGVGEQVGVWLRCIPSGDIEGRVRPRSVPPTAGALQRYGSRAPQPMPAVEGEHYNRRRDGSAFDAATVEAVWEKADPAPGYPGKRRDVCGALMVREMYGIEEQGGWFVDHIYPLSQGASDNFANLIPVRWENTRQRAGEYPEFGCAVSE